MPETELLANPRGGDHYESVALTAAERDLLADCEGVISRGLETFRQVGDALMQVRDNRLYRAEFGTFDVYCRQRWGLEPAHAYRAIQTAQVANAISSPNGEKIDIREAHARELAPLLDDPDELRSAYTEAVQRTDGKPTAAVIREVMRERELPEPSPQFSEALDRAMDERAAVEAHNAFVADLRTDITPEREAEILLSVRPAVEFAKLVDACREFLETVACIDLTAATHGFNASKASSVAEAVGLLAQLRQTLEVAA